MDSIFALIRNSLMVTSLDLDNALYMTSVVDQVQPRKKQQQLIFWGLLVEYLGRLILILFFQYVISGNQPLFELFGIPFSIESISLIAAGLFLTIRSGRELLAHLRGGDEAEVAASDIEGKSFSQILAQMSAVCLTLFNRYSRRGDDSRAAPKLPGPGAICIRDHSLFLYLSHLSFPTKVS